ncbi:autotransporter outer membrane beta-barrel domain-containing protein [Bartonella grahamii]|uniref:autotransporter outer membrane beta-barrel domain-containing protein n=1 Tax=Bartonella grahamii TaxID=33045 RepID=UPI002E7B36C3|nr:autotransporter outer membrane beta-barrel domain-containing protein [Bartonella grahamii]
MYSRFYFVFFSFNFTSTSTASGLSPQTHHTLEGIIQLPEQYRHATDLINTPTQAKKNLEKIASDAIMGDNSHLNQVLDADNQRRIDAARQQWVKQDNREWNKLQNKAEILHKAAKVDSALQGQNKELSNTLHKAVLDALNTDEITNVERKGETSSPLSKENKQPLTSSIGQGLASNKLPPANVAAQHKGNSSSRADRGIIQPKINENLQSDIDLQTNTASSASKTTLNTSAKAHVKLPTKVRRTATADTESTSKLTDNKETATSASLDLATNTKTLTPQKESSLAMPIAMFSVGFFDVNNQNISLDNMQITMFEPKDHPERGIFLSTYGNKSTFSSSIQADIRYAALQAGTTLIALNDQNISSNFGLFGTYGKLSFSPKNKESSRRNMLDKWSLTAYGNIQHDSGIYASAFLSYGIFKENNTTALIKHTSKVNNSKTLGAAATVGQKLSTGLDGVILEPQAQLVYQRLMLCSFSDEDNSKIDRSKPHQWLFRIGGRLTQNKGHALSFYGKLNMIKTFSKNFPLAAMEALIEGGFGIQTHLSQNIELHSDLSYQHKFKKAGISAINITAGMRYHF